MEQTAAKTTKLDAPRSYDKDRCTIPSDLPILKSLSLNFPTYLVLNIPISSWLNLRLAALQFKKEVTSKS